MRSLHDPAYTTRQATYDLRRLRRKGFIVRVAGTNTYRLTSHGRAMATTMTKLYARVVVPALSGLEDDLGPPGGQRRPIVVAWRRYEHELDRLIDVAGMSA
jgi:DNA-binding MarR family transcriptional regulator